MNETTIALVINSVLVAALVTAFSYSSVILGPRRKLKGDKGMPYETGMPPLESAAENMTATYYRFAVLFVIFDIDFAFLAPWVMMRDRLTFDAMIAISVFLGLAALTLAYVWKKGVLEN